MAVNTPTVEQILAQAQALSSRDLVRLMEHLFVMIQHNKEAPINDDETKRMQEWHDTVDSTYGALADDPIERGPQGDYEERDEIL